MFVITLNSWDSFSDVKIDKDNCMLHFYIVYNKEMTCRRRERLYLPLPMVKWTNQVSFTCEPYKRTAH